MTSFVSAQVQGSDIYITLSILCFCVSEVVLPSLHLDRSITAKRVKVVTQEQIGKQFSATVSSRSTLFAKVCFGLLG